jgi:hypothetical protein
MASANSTHRYWQQRPAGLVQPSSLATASFKGRSGIDLADRARSDLSPQQVQVASVDSRASVEVGERVQIYYGLPTNPRR